MPPNEKEVIKTLRSLVISSQNGLLANHLQRDFREMEGYPVPFQAFNYKSFVQFLEGSGEFHLAETHEGVHVRAKLSSDSLHIAQLVSSQNRVKKKKSTRPLPFMQRQNNRAINNNRNVFQAKGSRLIQQAQMVQAVQRAQLANQYLKASKPAPFFQAKVKPAPFYAPSHLSGIQMNPATLPAIPATGSSMTNAQRTNTSATTAPADNAPMPTAPSKTALVIDLTKSAMSTKPSDSSSSDDRWKHDRWTESPLPKKSVKIQEVEKRVAGHGSMPLLRRFNSVESNVMTEPKVEPKIKPKVESKSNPSVSSVWLKPKISPPMRNPCRKFLERMGLLKTDLPQQSPQARLNVKQPQPLDTVDFVAPQQTSTSLASIEQHLKNVIEVDSMDQLEKYCKERKFDRPVYSIKLSGIGKFEGVVRVAGMTYSTQPFDYADESEAHRAAAAVAMANTCKTFENFDQTTDNLAMKLYDCITENGIILTYLPELFKRKYNSLIPDGWENVIQNRSNMFTIDHQSTNVDILFKKSNINKVQSIAKPIDMHRVSRSVDQINKLIDMSIVENVNDNDTNEMTSIKLPWNDPIWSVDIAWINSTTDIWCQLSESDDLKDLNDGLEEVEMNFENGNIPELCQNVIINGIYLVVHQELTTETEYGFTFRAYRIKVIKIDEVQKKACCFYIDDGYEEWLSYDLIDIEQPKKLKIYKIPHHLLKFPPQAVNISLFNLEDFDGNSIANEACKCLKDKSLLARIKTSHKQYEAQPESDKKISVALYDMDDGIDVLMNKRILENICKQFTPPQLEKRLTVVYITYVTDTGNIYCRLTDNKDMENIKKIIERVTCNGIHEDHRITVNDLNDFTTKNLRLVFDTSTDRWYRAIILPQSHFDNVRCQFVDYGYIKPVPQHHIYKLEKLSTALNRYPHQTIVVRLHELNSREHQTPAVVKRIRELLSTKSTFMIQPMNLSEVPAVNIWTRNNGLLCKINDTLRMELDIEDLKDKIELPSNDASFYSNKSELMIDNDLPLHTKPECHQIYSVEVITAISPYCFYVRLISNTSEYKNMMHSLWKECEESDKILSKNDIKANHFYASRLEDGFWHRVKVESVLSNGSVVVLNWDRGNVSQLSIDAMRPLPSAYHQIPQMVFPARLHGIRPLQKVWNKDDCALFQESTVGKFFQAEVKDIQTDISCNNYFVAEITLVSQNNNISEQMILEQCATNDFA